MPVWRMGEEQRGLVPAPVPAVFAHLESRRGVQTDPSHPYGETGGVSHHRAVIAVVWVTWREGRVVASRARGAGGVVPSVVWASSM